MTAEEFDQQIANEVAYKFDAPKDEEIKVDPKEEEPKTDDEKGKIDSQLWLLVSSIVIAAILVLALAIIGFRKIKARFVKGQKILVKSKVPTDLEQEVKQAKTETTKKDVDDSEFID